MILKHKLMTASGVVRGVPCYWGGCFRGNDRTNDGQYEIYDDVVANTARIVHPEQEDEATTKAQNGWTLGEHVIDMERGMYLAMSGTNAKIVFLYRDKTDCE